MMVSIGVLLAGYAFGGNPESAKPHFSSVQPIFSRNCVVCHAGQNPSGNLRLDSYSGIMRGGKSGKAISSGSASKSLLYKRIMGTVAPKMPPGGALSASDIQKIRDWINGGALQ